MSERIVLTNGPLAGRRWVVHDARTRWEFPLPPGPGEAGWVFDGESPSILPTAEVSYSRRVDPVFGPMSEEGGTLLFDHDS